MPSILPEGDAAPLDGSLPPEAMASSAGRTLSLYAHIPFCAVRCGYCDFNTYTATELGHGASRETYPDAMAAELALAARVLDDAGSPSRPLSTVFFGGGTPTLLPAEDLARTLHRAVEHFGLVPGAEVTTEANPDSVSPESLKTLAAAGFTRVSFGMQSAVPHVLKVLDRTHAPEGVPLAVQWAREAGLGVSLDLIYGTPGESLEDWRTTLEAAIAMEPDHISAYALIIEDGTKLAAQIRRGEVPGVDDDDHADKYVLADQLLGQAGYGWYEVSNFARGPQHRAHHNVAYWLNQDWWGVGPGAHSHVGDVRWWNVKHPSAYQQRLDAGLAPVHARELPDAEASHLEDVMLQIRLSDGLPLSLLAPHERERVAGLVADGLADPQAALKPGADGERRVVLTLRGRLLADAVVRTLLGF
ncbi:radical SAM family heme chaperone HemW [Galactobacter caseinivorans]|uniref:Heme chaperone HemW n=1 Tax=Galactobacter caseinivorans TaxID=2676123 RepID=A0A496PKW0_9MICC|nr:radical SAM family heme chaperone HemW [Galactobacter caseinivorans]RKW71163.1 coproporphyrinogen III oxidase [Galactobacter caseinivorans]